MLLLVPTRFPAGSTAWNTSSRCLANVPNAVSSAWLGNRNGMCCLKCCRSGTAERNLSLKIARDFFRKVLEQCRQRIGRDRPQAANGRAGHRERQLADGTRVGNEAADIGLRQS